MKKIIKLIFKYGFLSCYFILSLVLILEACMPGEVSSGQSNVITETITSQTGIGSSAEFIEPKSIKIESIKNIYVGEKINVKCTILPENASKKTVKYKLSSNIASVSSDGTLVFNEPGKLILKVWIDEYKNIYDEIELEAEIKIVELESIEIHTNSKEFNVGSSYQLYPLFNPVDTTNQSVTWESLNKDIASIDENGKMTCLKDGEVTIKLTCQNKEVEKKFVVTTYEEIYISKLELSPTSNFENNILTITEGNCLDLMNYVTYEPINANIINLKWSTSNENIVDILPNGNITPIVGSPELIKIKVYLENDESIYDEILVKVISKKVVYNVDSEISTYVNANKKIEFKENSVFPNQYNLKYEIENEKIAKVDESGLVYGIKKGKTTCLITCESSDGTIAEYKIDINITNPPKQSFYLLIRKGIGHFGAFMVLAMIGFGVCLFFFKKKPLFIIISLALGFSIAGVTEIIQLYVPGRSGLFSDVMIDFSGYFVGTAITFTIFYIIILIRFILKRKGKKNEF